MTASLIVLGEIRKSGLPIEAQGFLGALSEGEGAPDFVTLYSSGNMISPGEANVEQVGKLRKWTGSIDQFPTWHGATVGQLISTAAGAFQFTRTTWVAVVKHTNTPDFSPHSQITNAWWLAQDDFQRRSGHELMDCLKAPALLPMVSTYLQRTWPGGCDVNFPKRYGPNLAALQAPPPVPVPDRTIVLDGLKRDGEAYRLVLEPAP